jgi:hypothetical protein
MVDAGTKGLMRTGDVTVQILFVCMEEKLKL